MDVDGFLGRSKSDLEAGGIREGDAGAFITEGDTQAHWWERDAHVDRETEGMRQDPKWRSGHMRTYPIYL